MEPVPLRVLCVDDSRDAADSTAQILELYGCEAAVCYDGPSALAAGPRFAPDVGLIDFNMPGMTGCEVAERLRVLFRPRHVFMIAVTAHGTDAARRMTAAAGFDLHLVKPVDWDELTAVLSVIEHGLGRAERIPTARQGRDRPADDTTPSPG